MLVIRRGGHSIKHAETVQAPWYRNSHYLCFGTHYSKATVSLNKPYCHSSYFQTLHPNNLNCKDFAFSSTGNHLDCEGMCVGTRRSKINSVLPDTLWLLAASEEKLRKQPKESENREKEKNIGLFEVVGRNQCHLDCSSLEILEWTQQLSFFDSSEGLESGGDRVLLPGNKNRTEGNNVKQLDIRKNFFTQRVARYWKGLPRAEEELQFLEVLRRCVDVAPGDAL